MLLKTRNERGMLHLCSSVKLDGTFFLMWHHMAINRESIPWLFTLHDTQILMVNIKISPGLNPYDWPSWKADNHVAFDILMPYKADQKVQLGWSAVYKRGEASFITAASGILKLLLNLTLTSSLLIYSLFLSQCGT